jgi:hypothetical protein
MGTKLAKACACLFCLYSAWGQFFVDFHASGTVGWRLLSASSASIAALPSLGVGIGTRLRSFAAPSIDVVLTGARLRSDAHEEYLVWAELHYRLLLQLRYRERHPYRSPAVAIEWALPFGLPASTGVRGTLSDDLRALRFGTFTGISFPLPSGGRYGHVLVGGQWLLRSPSFLRSAFLPELRLLWESR